MKTSSFEHLLPFWESCFWKWVLNLQQLNKLVWYYKKHSAIQYAFNKRCIAFYGYIFTIEYLIFALINKENRFV